MKVTKSSSKQGGPYMATIFFFLALLVFSKPVFATNQECGPNIIPANLGLECIPAVPLENEIDPTDGKNNGDWIQGTYKIFSDLWGLQYNPRVFVTYKRRPSNNVDLYLLFQFEMDKEHTSNDEVRIGLNPGTSTDENTLIKIFPWKPSAFGTYSVEMYNYDTINDTWDDILTNTPGNWPANAVVGTYNDSNTFNTGEWSVEVKIPLSEIPNYPITGDDFRLILEIHSEIKTLSGDNTIIYLSWPDHRLPPGANHDHICPDIQKWYPISFGTNCYPDLYLTNGIPSCDAVYILRNGIKSRDIIVDEDNDFHADVTNDHATLNAQDVSVYMTLSRFGIGSEPVAMNYDHNNQNIKDWFQQGFGSWMVAQSSLQAAVLPANPTFDVNAGTTNSDLRLTWNPSNEPNLANISDLLGHVCTSAFVAFKDDPNMSNNFCFCNLTYVDLQQRASSRILKFSVGSHLPFLNITGDSYVHRLTINALNTPFQNWFRPAKFKAPEGSVKYIGKSIMDLVVPKDREVTVAIEITPPQGEQSEKMRRGRPGGGAMSSFETWLKQYFGDMPIILIQGYVPCGYKTGAQGERVQLYRPTSYAAYALNLGGEGLLEARPFELTLFGGLTFWNSALGLNNGPGFGAKLGYHWVSGLTAELEAGMGFTKDTTGDNGNWFQFFGNFRYDIPVSGQLKPFVTAGVGYILFRNFAVNAQTFAYQGGAGLTYAFTRSFGLRLEARVIRLGSVWTAPATTNFQATGGLIFWF